MDGITASDLRAELVHDLATIDAVQWDACVGPDDPFSRHAFLRLLEDSGSIGDATGFAPRHLVVRGPDGRVLGAAPMYLKSSSAGEFLNDAGWARAYAAGGGRYFPKLAIGVPLVPAVGDRLMRRPGAPVGPGLLADLIGQAVGGLGASSAHLFFAGEEDRRACAAAGWLEYCDVQYLWENRGYRDFAAFLAALRPDKASRIRGERRKVAQSGVRIHTLPGGEVGEARWHAFHRLYEHTFRRKGGTPLLTAAFFCALGAAFGERVVLMLAEEAGRWVAGLLCLIEGDRLYIRTWGAEGAPDLLVFEMNAYRTVELAIERGLRWVGGSAGGGYKCRRGFDPVLVHSCHRFADPGFHAAVGAAIERDNAAVIAWHRAELERSAYRRAADGTAGRG